MSILGELQLANGQAWVELFEIDATAQGGDVTRFHAGTNGLRQPVVWQGNTYEPFPIMATGFEASGQQMARPKLAVANVNGLISAMLMQADLLGAKVIRRRTMVKFLDDVNFPIVQKPTPAVLTFTRSSTATYYGSDGLLKTAAANQPRIDYDPLTLVVRGLLIEEQRTNLISFSSQFDNANYSKANITITPDATIAPDGTLTADKAEVTTTTFANANRTVTATSTSLTYSIFTKKGNRTTAIFLMRNGTTATNFDIGTFNYDTGTFTSGAGWSAQALPNGWYRLTYSRTTGITVGDTISLYWGVIGGSQTAGEFWYVWGLQLEAGAFATSYIPTTTAAVTRAADNASVTGANFSSFYNATEGTVQVAFTPLQLANNTRIAELSGGTAARVADLYISGAKAAFYNGTAVASVGSTFTSGTPYSIAAGYKASDYGYASGGVLATASTATLNTATALYIGRFNDGSLSLNGYIRNVRYYPRRLTNAELQSVTSGGTVADLPGFELDASTGSLAVYTLAQYNPTADPNSYLPDDIWYISQKTTENAQVVEFELASPVDLEGVMIPGRQIQPNLCAWRYRGDGCGYAGGPVADANDSPTSILANDRCSKRISGCKLRWGSNAELPFGGFPGAGLVRR